MFEPIMQSSKLLAWLAPNVLRQTTDDTLPTGVGGFRLSAYYSGERSKLSRRQFTGKATLNLHDTKDGAAVVAISDVGLTSLAYVRSTGHDVALSELQRPNLLVPFTGTLSSRNENVLFERKNEPWLLIGRGTRETTVHPKMNAVYQAFVLSMPPEFLGDRIARVEELGGMIWGDASNDNDLHLGRLTLALATKVSLSKDAELDTHLAEAWTTVLLDQLKRCLDARLSKGVVEPNFHAHDPSIIYVRRAEALIQKKLGEIGSLRDIALHVGISERTLQGAFRKVRGATPMQVLAQARLHRARLALLDRQGPKTVSDVCSMCGIEHHGRFSKLYKGAYGESPVATLHSRAKR